MSQTIASQFLAIQNIRTHLLSAGDNGTPVLLLHGGGVDSARLSWGLAIEPLAENHHSLVKDFLT
jgi:pimeloyl-ACP methyl ester carboxylesterase